MVAFGAIIATIGILFLIFLRAKKAGATVLIGGIVIGVSNNPIIGILAFIITVVLFIVFLKQNSVKNAEQAKIDAEQAKIDAENKLT